MTNPIDFSFQMIPARDSAQEEVFFSALDAEGRSTMLVIKHLSGSGIAFALKTNGQPDQEGSVLPSPSMGPHRLLLAVGPWLVNAPPEQRSRVEVRLDDDLVLSGLITGTMSQACARLQCLPRNPAADFAQFRDRLFGGPGWFPL